MLNFNRFQDVRETGENRFAQSVLGKEAKEKTFEKPESYYDRPFEESMEMQKNAVEDIVNQEYDYNDNEKGLRAQNDLSHEQESEAELSPHTTAIYEDIARSNNIEQPENGKKGGSYRDVKAESEGERYEVHHMPADSASRLERGDGPAIKMEKEDHRQTASCGMSREAREYREIQKELIEQGKFREAQQMDIDDIREKFGDKYDDAIREMLEYVDKLEEGGKI